MKTLYAIAAIALLLMSTSAMAVDPSAKTRNPGKAAYEESFVGASNARWTHASGDWAFEERAQLFDIRVDEIYRSPEEPSHVAWVGLWKQKDGSARISFAEVKGNPALDPSYVPTYGRGRTEESWRAFIKDYGMGFWPFVEGNKTTTIVHPTLVSKNGGDTWKNLGINMEPRGGNLRFAVAKNGDFINHGMATIVCRDGRLVAAPGADWWIKQRKADGAWLQSDILCVVAESLDNGKTWSEWQQLKPEGSDPQIIKDTHEEVAMVELADGRIMVIVGSGGSPVLTYLTRIGPGKYEASVPRVLPMPHTGMPELARCSDGAIWFWGISGHWYTLDDGKTWYRLPQVFTSYYGKMTDVGPDRILCVTQKGTGDSPYPWFYDASVEATRFRYRRIGIATQKDPAARLAVTKRNDQSFKDLHLRAKIRLDKADGVAFRMSADGKSGYLFAVVMPGSEAYDRWFAEKTQPDILSALEISERYVYAQGSPMAVIARLDNGALKVLRGVKCNAKKGNWLQLQVKVTGDLIQGAVHVGTDIDNPRYAGTRDKTYASGTIGLMSDQSQGEFKEVAAWAKPLMMRDLWTLNAEDK